MEVTKNKEDQNKSKETGKAEIDPAIIEELMRLTSRNGKNRMLRPSKDIRTKRKRSRIRLQLVLCDDWHGNTGCLVAQDLALLTKVALSSTRRFRSLPCFIFRFLGR
jgi:hypothetical protein